MSFVVLGVQLEQGAGQLLQGPISQAEALEDGVACHTDDARVIRSPRAEQTLPQGSDQSASSPAVRYAAWACTWLSLQHLSGQATQLHPIIRRLITQVSSSCNLTVNVILESLLYPTSATPSPHPHTHPLLETANTDWPPSKLLLKIDSELLVFCHQLFASLHLLHYSGRLLSRTRPVRG